MIKCKGAAEISIDNLREFQGDLKELTKENFDKLKHTILTEGYCDPGSVWEDGGIYWVIDMHQRLFVLKALRSEGYYVPPIPVNFVYPKDKEEAKKLVLTFSSNYGKLTEDSVSNYCIDSSIELSFLETSVVFPEVDLNYFTEGNEPLEEAESLSQDDSDLSLKCESCGAKIKSKA
jgi:hypothetical protein